MPIKDKITNLLNEQKIEYKWEDHPPVFTVEESLEHLNGRHPIKNLLLTDKKESVKILIIMSGELRLNIKNLAKSLNLSKLQFASRDILMETLGVEPGSVSLFGLLHEGSAGTEVLIDQNLLDYPEIGFHPNDNSATIFLNPNDIEKIVEITGHNYKFVDI